MKISALFSMWIWNRCVMPSIMSNVSDKNCVFNKMAIHQKRKASFRGTRTQNICFIMTLFYSTLNVFSGSINYLSEGALIQPTLSFSTTGSHSSGKTRYYFYIRYFCINIDFQNTAYSCHVSYMKMKLPVWYMILFQRTINTNSNSRTTSFSFVFSSDREQKMFENWKIIQKHFCRNSFSSS